MKNKYIIIALAGIALSVSSCKKGCTDPAAENYDATAKKNNNTCTYADPSEKTSEINLVYNHMAENSTFAFNTDYIDDFGNKYQFTRAQLYLSSPVFMDDNMNVLSAPSSYALVSPDSVKSSFAVIDGEQHVHMMNISIGVDSVANATDPATYGSTHPLAYQTPSMHWNWNSGYIFIALEGVVDIDGNGTFDTGETFVMHVGMNSLRADNTGLMAHFNSVSGLAHNIELDINWTGLLAGIDLSIDNSTHTMDNMMLASRVSNNAKSILSIHM